MEPFIIGVGIGCLVGIAAAYLIVSHRMNDDPPAWLDILKQQGIALEELEAHRAKPRALTRLTNHQGTVEL